MRYFFDTEFIEDGKTIDLISIGIVSEDGVSFYQVSREFNPGKASKWVKDNVFPHLPPMAYGEKFGTIWGDLVNLIRPGTYWRPRRINPLDPSVSAADKIASAYWSDRSEIKRRVFQYANNSPEFWAYYADYDWVVFCQLFGTMMDLPEGFPMYCRDLKQEADRLGVDLSKAVPQENEHHALADAKWNRKAWEYLQTIAC